MSKRGSDRALWIAVLVVLAIPGYQCLSLSHEISTLATEITETKAENESMLREINALHEGKLSQCITASRELNELGNRAQRNEGIAKSTEEARDKLTQVKLLIQEHNNIRSKLEVIRRSFSEL